MLAESWNLSSLQQRVAEAITANGYQDVTCRLTICEDSYGRFSVSCHVTYLADPEGRGGDPFTHVKDFIFNPKCVWLTREAALLNAFYSIHEAILDNDLRRPFV